MHEASMVLDSRGREVNFANNSLGDRGGLALLRVLYYHRIAPRAMATLSGKILCCVANANLPGAGTQQLSQLNLYELKLSRDSPHFFVADRPGLQESGSRSVIHP